MPSPAFDTHAEIRKLQEAGCAEEQAEAMVDLVSRAPGDSRVLTRLDGVDTRLDRIDTRLDGVDTRLDGIDTRLDRFESSVDVRFERLGGRMESLESRIGMLKAAMVTGTKFAQEFTKLHKHLLIGGLGICAIIVTAFVAVVTTFIALSLS